MNATAPLLESWNRTWYQGDERGAGEVGDALSCDEYPFYTSRQGGPGASLWLVPGWEQDKQGGFLSAFYVPAASLRVTATWWPLCSRS